MPYLLRVAEMILKHGCMCPRVSGCLLMAESWPHDRPLFVDESIRPPLTRSNPEIDAESPWWCRGASLPKPFSHVR